LDSEDLNLITNPLNQYIKILGISDRNINSFIALNHDTSRNTIKDIISYVKSLGYQFVPMNECIGLNPYQNNENNNRSEINNSEKTVNKNYNALAKGSDDNDELIYITMDSDLMDDAEYTTLCMTYDDEYPTNDDHSDEYVTSCSVYDIDDDDNDIIITTTSISEYSEMDDGNKNNEIDNINNDDIENGSIKTHANYAIIMLIISFIYLIF